MHVYQLSMRSTWQLQPGLLVASTPQRLAGARDSPTTTTTTTTHPPTHPQIKVTRSRAKSCAIPSIHGGEIRGAVAHSPVTHHATPHATPHALRPRPHTSPPRLATAPRPMHAHARCRVLCASVLSEGTAIRRARAGAGLVHEPLGPVASNRVGVAVGWPCAAAPRWPRTRSTTATQQAATSRVRRRREASAGSMLLDVGWGSARLRCGPSKIVVER